MYIKTVTVEISYNVFEPGDKVTATSSRCSLEYGEVYTVVKFVRPTVPLELKGTVFVEGREYGISAEYLQCVKTGDKL